MLKPQCCTGGGERKCAGLRHPPPATPAPGGGCLRRGGRWLSSGQRSWPPAVSPLLTNGFRNAQHRAPASRIPLVQEQLQNDSGGLALRVGSRGPCGAPQNVGSPHKAAVSLAPCQARARPVDKQAYAVLVPGSQAALIDALAKSARARGEQARQPPALR